VDNLGFWVGRDVGYRLLPLCPGGGKTLSTASESLLLLTSCSGLYGFARFELLEHDTSPMHRTLEFSILQWTFSA
jgi:hypothetical protein